MRLLQAFDEPGSKDFAENMFGEEEARISGAHPVRVTAGEATGGHDAVNMRMMLELLIPGMQNAEEADFSAQVSGICSDLDQRLGTCAKQQPVDHFFVLQSQRRQLMRKCEDDVSIGNGQQFGATRFEPAFARLALTLGTVPVAA